MKKFLVALLAICLVVSCFSMIAFADEDVPANSTEIAQASGEAKQVDGLVGMYYNQGESGYGVIFDDVPYQTDYDWNISADLAKTLTGTDRIPFYADDRDGAVYFDTFAQQAFLYEINYAAAAGVDFVAYRYYSGYGKSNGVEANLQYMNYQLKLHSTYAGQTIGFDRPVDFAVVLGSDFGYADAKSTIWKHECNALLQSYVGVKGYLTTSDNRPVIFIQWSDIIAEQITNMNENFKKAVEKGIDAGGKKVKLSKFDVGTQIYYVALDAPSYDDAVAAGAQAVSWYEGSGSNGEAYTSMTAKTEAKWASASQNVIPNVVTGFDKTPLAKNPIEVTSTKYTKEDPSIVYSRSAADTDFAAKGTADEFMAHVKNAVAVDKKPSELNAIMVYAWDDFAGGAYLCPTKTGTQYEYEYSFLKAMRNYFYGTEEGFPVMEAPYGVSPSQDPADPAASADPNATADPNAPQNPDDPNGGAKTNVLSLPLIIGIAGGAVVLIAAVVVIVVVVSKKKKKAE